MDESRRKGRSREAEEIARGLEQAGGAANARNALARRGYLRIFAWARDLRKPSGLPVALFGDVAVRK